MMELTEILQIFNDCKKAVKTVKGAECDKCPLSDDVWLTMPVQDETGVLSEVSLKVMPCLILQKVVGAIKA